jgi:hypothetical protein
MLNKYIVTVQELHEKRYLVRNAVAPQQAQEWVEIHMENDLSDLLEENIQDMDDTTRFITDGRNNIVENLRDINIKKVSDKDLPYHLKTDNEKLLNMGCTCGYDEEETRYHEQETCCPDDKCNCNS